jgi:hypothetical protein
MRFRSLCLDVSTGLRGLPETRVINISVKLDGVCSPFALEAYSEDANCLREDGALWWRADVSFPSDEHDDRANEEDDCG